MNLYTWYMSHATYRFLLFALTWYLILTNGQSIPRDTRTVFSLPLVIVSLRIGHWCFIFRWTCSPNVNTKNKCWVKFDSATCTLQTTFRSNNGASTGHVSSDEGMAAGSGTSLQWSPQWRRQGTHVGSTWSHWPVMNQHVRARPGAIEPWRAWANGSLKDVRVSRSFFIF